MSSEQKFILNIFPQTYLDCIDEIRNHTFYTISEENENKYVKTLAYKTTELKVNAVSALLLLTPVLEKSLGDTLAAYSFLPGTSNIKVCS